MTDFPFGIHKGDRVRVTFEGVVVATHGDSYAVRSSDVGAGALFTYRVVEKVAPPLPTTPGSVIVDPEGVHYFLGESHSGGWRDHWGDTVGGFDSEFVWRVIFDAGAS